MWTFEPTLLVLYQTLNIKWDKNGIVAIWRSTRVLRHAATLNLTTICSTCTTLSTVYIMR